MASYGHTFTSGDTVTPTKLNNARTVSEIVNADIKSDAAIAGTKIAPNFGSQNVVTTGNVGAGTASPSAKLEVVGNVKISGNNQLQIFNAAGTGGVSIQTDDTATPAMTFNVAGAERLRIDSTGNILLAGDSTQERFMRVGNGRSGSGTSYIDLQGDATYGNGMRLIRGNDGPNAASNIEHRGTGPLQLVTQEAGPIVLRTNAAERLRIDSSGNVGIATSAPSYKLHVNGSVAGVGAYNDVSDAREKQNISYDFQHGLQTVRELKPAHFDYLGNGPQNNLGFIAQDIQQVLPCMVTTFNKTVGEGDEATTEERLAIKEANLIAVLVKAVQELDLKVSALEAAQ
jgi:hypothetical protein